MSGVRITSLEVENVKRVRAVTLEPSDTGLTVIGGRNGQGKTSVLDAVMWTLGGDRFRPTAPLRDGADKIATKIELTNGLVAERRGEGGGVLKVTDTTGKRGGQALLNEFVSVFALDLPKFINASATEKAQMLLAQYPGLGAELQRLNVEHKRIYDERLTLGRIAEQKAKYAAELAYHADAPDELLTGAQMTAKMQDALAVNAKNAELRRRVGQARTDADRAQQDVSKQQSRVAELESRLAEERQRLGEAQTRALALEQDAKTAALAVTALVDADTTALQSELERIDTINAAVRANMDKRRAEDEAEELGKQYHEQTAALETVRAARLRLLASIELPLPDLSIDEEGELVYRARRWDCMSGAEQLRVAVAICGKIKPECGFVLLDGLERMDVMQLREFGEWLRERDMQAIGTRVSVGGECSIVIEDGAALDAQPVAAKVEKKKAGQFEF